MTIAGYMGALAVACGAFGAHALKGRVDDYMLDVWNTAAHYHLIHSVAVLCLEKSTGKDSSGSSLAVKLISFGTALFSGSLYLMVLTGYKKLGIITPIGGTVMIFGWLSIAM